MLINALCDYYDVLKQQGKVLADGWSAVPVSYLVALKEDGTIDEIINYQKKEEIIGKKGTIKERWVPRNVMFPKRTEKSGIDPNIIEHRPLYLFGLNYVDGSLVEQDRTGKAKKSHEMFVASNLKFLEGLDSPVINAYRNFIKNWNPQNETENVHLLGLGKKYESNFAFCLSGHPEQLVQENDVIGKQWETQWNEMQSGQRDQAVIGQCAISGKMEPLARIHGKIKGIYGGLATGSVFIGYNNDSECSYGKEQAYNSNISERMMKKYTEALNYLLSDRRHKVLLDDITVVFWAADGDGNSEDMFMAMLMGESEGMSAQQMNDMLRKMFEDAAGGNLVKKRLTSVEGINPDIDFYMIGMRPNSSRVSVKFVYKKKYAQVLWNLAQHQWDMQITEEIRPISFARIRKNLVSPKSTNEKVNPALMSKVLEAAFQGTPYPAALLETIIRRIKTDTDARINETQAGIIKACINRKSKILYQKEELKVALDRENTNQAYLCGRLFAVLEKLQQDASGNTLNRTIKDAYFSSASSTPAVIFPKLLRLAQNHLNKVKHAVYYSKLVGEIMNALTDEFPDVLRLEDQGRFMIGYYQQYQSFFVKNSSEQNDKVETEE